MRREEGQRTSLFPSCYGTGGADLLNAVTPCPEIKVLAYPLPRADYLNVDITWKTKRKSRAPRIFYVFAVKL